jgi:HPt (histidine-containing phosphotransfer) domain-containing protein
MEEGERVPDTLSDTVHALAGTVGMFGFLRLADIGRRFERAARANAIVLPALASDLVASLEVSLREVRLRARHVHDTVTALEPTDTRPENALALS